MPILIRGLTLTLDEPEELLREKAAARLRVAVDNIGTWAIVRRSLDARKHDRLCYTYNLEMALAGSTKQEIKLVERLHRQDVTLLEQQDPPEVEPGNNPLPYRPIIVGFGPAGMFAGLMLAEFGYGPMIIERGFDVKTRHRDILLEFHRHGNFNPESNYLFGVGGAGTYSDGKLYTRVKDPRCQIVLETLYRYGADPSVLIEGKPHIGSDRLPLICRRIREQIIALGGEVRFGSRLDDVLVQDNRLTHVVVNGEKIACGPVLLGIGLSARDTYRMLARQGVAVETKSFQLGVRIEHPQDMVDRWQYGKHSGHARLPAAEYHLVAKKAAGERGDVFSFCMCPGGMILPTNESAGLIATNGASRSKRNGQFANSGLVMTIDPNEACPQSKDNPLAVLDYLEQLERNAFELTGQSYKVPAQRASDFIQQRKSDGELVTSYPFGGQWTQMQQVLPDFVAQAIARAIEKLDKRLPGFGQADALVTAPETRASSPLRILRDHKSRQSTTAKNLYPIGEGAGYAGGITSAAIDGLKTAEKVIGRYCPPENL